MNLSQGHMRLLLTAACTALFVALRCLSLDADPPRGAQGVSTRELFVEPAAKAHEARNYGLFGAFKINPVDNYQFWRAQSPLWVYPLAGYFAALGVDYPQLRTFSTLYAAFGFALLLWMAADLMRPSVWVFVGLLLALDPLYFHTSRVGILEPAVASWLTLSMFALFRAERDARWVCLALLAFVLAFFTKQAAVYGLPVIGLAGSYRLLRASGRTRLIVLGCGLLLCALSALYITNTDYMRAVTHNVNHMLVGESWHTSHRYRGVESLVGRLLDPERRWHFLVSLPISGSIALACCAGFAVQSLRHRRLPSYRELVVLGWFVCALVAMAVIARSELRFWTVAVPPAALVAGLGVEHALRALELRARSVAVRTLPLAVPLLLLLLVSAHGHAQYFGHLAYSVRDAGLALEKQIGARDATIVGQGSPGLVLGTPYKNFYMRGGFNAKRDLIVQLGITHFLFHRRDGVRRILERRFDGIMRDRQHVLTIEVRGDTYNLFDVEGQLTVQEPKKKKKKKRR